MTTIAMKAQPAGPVPAVMMARATATLVQEAADVTTTQKGGAKGAASMVLRRRAARDVDAESGPMGLATAPTSREGLGLDRGVAGPTVDNHGAPAVKEQGQVCQA